jgi:phosphopantetheinyl transferase (holo-ACP synthase)
LSDGEREVYAELRDVPRREGWLLGRIMAKRLILGTLMAPPALGRGIHPAVVQIHSRDGLGRAIRPRILLHGRLQPWSLSIAHSDRSVLVALSDAPGVSLGVDVTLHQALGAGFEDTWLTPWERGWLRDQVGQGRPPATSALWAVKEAFYKAANGGEPFVPRRIEVRLGEGGDHGVRFGDVDLGDACRVQVAEVDTEIVAIVTTGAERSGATR